MRLTGVDKAVARLKKIATISEERYAQLGNAAVSGVKSNFEGNPLGWPALSPNTIAAKGSSQILVDSTQMKNSVFWRKGNRGLELYSRDTKAAWMHFGTRPHDIYGRFSGSRFVGGKRQPMLRFKTTTGFVFRRMVKHPGTPPRPWMVIRAEIRLELVEILRRQLRGEP